MKEREALKLALDALNEWRVEWSPDFYEGKYDSDEPEENTRRTLVKSAITAAEKALAQPEQEPKCNPHPKAPHGFNRNASHANDRYTCDCEGWDAYEAGRLDGIAQEQAMHEVQRLGQEIQPEQEPVAYINIEKRRLEWAHNYVSWNTPTTIKLDRIPLYTKEKL